MIDLHGWRLVRDCIRKAAETTERGFRACIGTSVFCDGAPVAEGNGGFYYPSQLTRWLAVVDIPSGASRIWPHHKYGRWLSSIRRLSFADGRPSLVEAPLCQFDFASMHDILNGSMHGVEHVTGLAANRVFKACMAVNLAMTSSALVWRPSWGRDPVSRREVYHLLGVTPGKIRVGETEIPQHEAYDHRRFPTVMANYRREQMVDDAIDYLLNGQGRADMARELFLEDCDVGLPVTSPVTGEFVGLLTTGGKTAIRLAVPDSDKPFVDIPVTDKVNLMVDRGDMCLAGAVVGHDGPKGWINNQRRRVWRDVAGSLGAGLPRVVAAWLRRQPHVVDRKAFLPYALVPESLLSAIDHDQSLTFFPDGHLWDSEAEIFVLPPLTNRRHNAWDGWLRGVRYDFGPQGATLVRNAPHSDNLPAVAGAIDENDRTSVFTAGEAVRENLAAFYARRARKNGGTVLPTHCTDEELDVMINGNC